MNCFSKFSLDVLSPKACDLMGQLLEKFKQIGPRITEFISLMPNVHHRVRYVHHRVRYGSNDHDTIKQKVLEQMKNLKILELYCDPEWIYEKDRIKTHSYLFQNFEAFKGLEKLKLKLSSESSICTYSFGNAMIRDYVPLLPKLKRLEIEFS
jgi:predicted ABC-type ATPase